MSDQPKAAVAAKEPPPPAAKPAPAQSKAQAPRPMTRAGRIRRMAWTSAVLVVVALGGWQRGAAVQQLPPDYDELVYLPVAFRYAERMTPGRWTEIPEFAENAEHPPLVKLLYAVELKAAGTKEPAWDSLKVGRPIPPEAQSAFRGPRWLSWVFSELQLAAVAAVNPLGGLFLAFSTYSSKYGAQAYLEAVPGLFAVLAVLLFEGAVRRRKGETAPPPIGGTSRRDLLLGSAVFLGLATAGKYPYGLVLALTLAPFFFRDLPQRFGWWIAYAAVALGTFFLAQPYLWPDPLGRLGDAVGFHWAYSHGAHVKEADLPWAAPLYFLTHSEPMRWHQGLFATPIFDWALVPLALVGFGVALKRRPIWAAWAVIGVAFLLAWPTKWPQYLLLVLPAVALCAGFGVQLIVTSPYLAWRKLRPARARAG